MAGLAAGAGPGADRAARPTRGDDVAGGAVARDCGVGRGCAAGSRGGPTDGGVFTGDAGCDATAGLRWGSDDGEGSGFAGGGDGSFADGEGAGVVDAAGVCGAGCRPAGCAAGARRVSIGGV